MRHFMTNYLEKPVIFYYYTYVEHEILSKACDIFELC